MKRLLLMVLFFTLHQLQAQHLSKKMIDQVIETITDHIEANYILPEKVKEITEYFNEDHKNGRFLQAKSLKELDSIMTKSLREASDDYHLYTWNNYELVEQLKSEKTKVEETEKEETINFFNDEKAYQSNFGFDRVEVMEGNIGYIKLSEINISEYSLEKLYGTMRFVDNTNALIIDLRDNNGGGSTVGPVLESFFFDQYTELLEFRSRNSESRIEGTVRWLLEKKYLKPLYILTNKGTASAAEAFAFALKNQNRCTIVGQPSSGGAYMNTYFQVSKDFVVAISTAAPFIPGTNVSWQGVGIQPDYLVKSEEALTRAIQLINE